MNEIKKIHLGRQPFTISVDAHKLLRDYLEAIEKRVGAKSEVLKEVEMRMAELLTERGINGEKVILEDDVKFLKDQLGSPSDFGDSEDETPAGASEDADAPKRLYRDEDNAMLGGVAAGLANYFGMDVVIFRILFVVFAFTGGASIFIYILLWLVVPPAKTQSEKLQMRGKAVTVDSLKEMVDRADVKGAANRASKYIAPAAEKLTYAILAVIGSVLVTVAMVMLAGLVIASTYTFFHHGDLIAGAVAFPVGGRETAGVIAAAVVIGCLSLMILLGGLTMARRKSLAPGWVSVTLVTLFIAAGGVAAAVVPDTINGIRDRYHAAQKTSIQEVQPFKSVTIEGHDVPFVYERSDKYEVGVRYLGKNISTSVKSSVKDGELTIHGDKFNGNCEGFCLTPNGFSEIVIRAPKVDKVTYDDGNTTLYKMPSGVHINTMEYDEY